MDPVVSENSTKDEGHSPPLLNANPLALSHPPQHQEQAFTRREDNKKEAQKKNSSLPPLLSLSMDERQQLGLMVSDILMGGGRVGGKGMALAGGTGGGSGAAAATHSSGVVGGGGARGAPSADPLHPFSAGHTPSGMDMARSGHHKEGTLAMSTSTTSSSGLHPTTAAVNLTSSSSSPVVSFHWRHRLPPPLLSEVAPGPTPLWYRVVASAMESVRVLETQEHHASMVYRKLEKELRHYHEEAVHRVERERRQQRESRARLGAKLHVLSERYWKRRGEVFQQAMRAEFQTFRQHYDRQKQEDMLAETEALTKTLVESMLENRKVLFPPSAPTTGSEVFPEDSKKSTRDMEMTHKEEEEEKGLRSTQSDPNSATGVEEEDGRPSMDSSSTVTQPPLALLDTLGGTRPLRSYQCSALIWMIHLFENRLNGILADEMGLGKTVQTIALLCYYAQYHNDWGPHLIVVPTTVMLNWRDELQRWAPGLKIMVYMGSKKERQWCRKGWLAEDAFHVCITSYTLIVHDRAVFRRRPWGFLVLDEAHQIKNFLSRKWQSLFDLNVEYRLLLTGTPLQNSMMELWSLFHFLLPSASAFRSNEEFKEWFSNPLEDMVAGRSALNESIIRRLQGLLRPFILRRLKRDVESQLPTKTEHVVRCRLSRRQRGLYDEYMQRRETRQKFEKGGVFSVLLALRKVCNHPDLFSERPTISPFVWDRGNRVEVKVPRLVLLQEQTFRYAFPGTSGRIWDLEVCDLNAHGNEEDKKKKTREATKMDAVAMKKMSKVKKRRMEMKESTSRRSIKEEEDEDEEDTNEEEDEEEEDEEDTNEKEDDEEAEEEEDSASSSSFSSSSLPLASGKKEQKRRERKRRRRNQRGDESRASFFGSPRVSSRPSAVPECLVWYAEQEKRRDAYSSPFDWLPCPWLHLNVLWGSPPPLGRKEVYTTARPSSCSGRCSLVSSSFGLHHSDVSSSFLHRFSPIHFPSIFHPETSTAEKEEEVQGDATDHRREEDLQLQEHHTEESETEAEALFAMGRLPLSIGLQSMLASSCSYIVNHVIKERRRWTYQCQAKRQQEVGLRSLYLYYPRCVTSIVVSSCALSPCDTAEEEEEEERRHGREGGGGKRSPSYRRRIAEEDAHEAHHAHRAKHKRNTAKAVAASAFSWREGWWARQGGRLWPEWGTTAFPATTSSWLSSAFPDLLRTMAYRMHHELQPLIPHVAFVVPKAVTRFAPCLVCALPLRRPSCFQCTSEMCASLLAWARREAERAQGSRTGMGRTPKASVYEGSFFLSEWWTLQVRRCFRFPDRYLLIHDCGKLQYLKEKLVLLRTEGHRALVFTQFVKMLDVLERFLALIGVAYLRLDGSTRAEQRQLFVNRFNSDDRITVMILSTRSGGIGLNLTGADTVIFYDSDWNPTMDLQAQDRCHRIGQTRPVTVYRLVSAHTVEESILEKARERKKLNNVVIRGGRFHAIADVVSSPSSSSSGAINGTEGESTGGIGEEEPMDDATAIAWTMLSMKTDLRSFFHDMDEDVELPLFHHGSGNRTAEKDNEEEEDVEGKEEEEDSQTAILLDGRRRQRHQRKSGYEDTDETGTPLSPLSSLPHSSLEVTDVLEEMKRAEDDEDREALEQVEAEIQERKREDEVSEGDENDKEDEEEEDRGGGGGEGVPSPREKRVCFEDGAHEAAETPREQLLHPSCPSDERLGDTAGKICKKKGEEKDESGWEGLATGSKKTMSSVFSQTWQEAWGEGRWSAPEDTPLLPMESKRENEGKEEHRKEIGEEEEETQMHNGEEEEVEGTRQVSRAAETYPTSSSSLYSTEPALLRTAMRRQRTFLQQRTRSRLDRLLTRHYPLYRPEKAEELYEELCEEYEQKVHIEGAELPPFRRQLA